MMVSCRPSASATSSASPSGPPARTLPTGPDVGDQDLSPFYRFNTTLPPWPGLTLREEAIPVQAELTAAASALRVLYTSLDARWNSGIVPVSGTLYLPKGTRPSGGWPLVAWAHGTLGVADVCAPSWAGHKPRDATYINRWLAAGFAVVATDYQGLGGPGPHPYLIWEAEGRSVLDAARAALQAHSAALATGTIAVLAGGIDQVYPLRNARLHADIGRRGLLLSEMPWGLPPYARAFPRRNRIVSGLSSGVVVVEAAARSGSMITARLAAEQGRDVFVVPGSPADPHYDGSNTLLRDGAILVRHANDILRGLERPTVAAQPLGESSRKAAEPGVAKVLAALGSVPTAVDELVRRCQVSAAAMAEVLLALELEGRLERHRGNRVSLI